MNLQCPKCGGDDIVKAGSTGGLQRYSHSWSGRKKCPWHGTAPVGRERAQAAGIDRKAVDALHKEVRTAKVARYVITSAQNATAVNDAFLASLLTYCKHRDAKLLVIPYRYKNPTSMWSQKAQDDDWWASGLAQYLIDRRVDICANLVLLADIKTQPTASRPLLGFETLTGGKSAIVGHPKLELISVPTPQHRMAKILTTTGSVTKKNYIPGKAGKKAEHHHTFGAAVVEVKGDNRFHLRQINAVSDGSFIDLDHEYDGDKVTHVPQAAGLVMGDSHIRFIDPGVVKATFDAPDSIVKVLNPAEIVWHDALDFHSGNHHHRKKVFIKYGKYHAKRDNVEREVDEACAFIDRVTRLGVANVFVASNHPDAFARWVEETDPRTDPENAVFWAQTFEAMCKGTRWGESGPQTIDPFAYWAKIKLKTAKQAIFLARDESHGIRGIEATYHGDQGPNGSRGDLGGFGKVGVKTVIGHGHGPGQRDGAIQVGTSSRLRLEYNSGPSSWLHTHCVVYRNGKRSLINIIDGEWRA
jgi:hypothetical protein